MKVMQVNVVYPVGSTGKIVNDIHKQLLEDGHESIVCYGRGIEISESNIYKIAPEFIMKMQSLQAKMTGFAYGGASYSTNRLIKIIANEKADIIHLHCINGFMVNIYRLLEYLKEKKIPTVLTLHAEFMYTAGCGYSLDCEKWKSGCGNCPQRDGGRPASVFFDKSAQEWMLMKKAIEPFDNLFITVVSPWIYKRAMSSPFFKNKKIHIILNGIDTENVFRPHVLKRDFEMDNKKIVLHVTASFKNPIKGGEYVIRLAEQLPEIIFIIIGFDGDKKRKLPANIYTVSKIENQQNLAKYYSLADLTILTSKKETFSMVCAESLACGTPVVGFKAGAPELIALKEFSEFVDFGNIDFLKTAILRWINKKNMQENIYEKAKSLYSRRIMYEKYVNLYKQCIKQTRGW